MGSEGVPPAPALRAFPELRKDRCAPDCSPFVPAWLGRGGSGHGAAVGLLGAEDFFRTGEFLDE